MNIYKLVLLFALLSAPVMAAQASESSPFELNVSVEGFTGSTSSRFLVWAQKDLTEHVKLTASFDQEGDGYREGYIGPTWAPTELFSIGVGVGRESEPNSFRKAAWMDLGSSEGTLIEAIFEDGGSGAWHRVSLVTKVSKHLGLGIMHETDVGLGPRFEFTMNKHFQLWGSVLRNSNKETTAVLALSISR